MGREGPVGVFPHCPAGSHLGQAHSRCRWAPGPPAELTALLPSPQITSSSPSHPANSFYYPRLKALPPIARVTLVRLRQSPRAFVPPAIDLAGRGNEIGDGLSGKPRSHPHYRVPCPRQPCSWAKCSGPREPPRHHWRLRAESHSVSVSHGAELSFHGNSSADAQPCTGSYLSP